MHDQIRCGQVTPSCWGSSLPSARHFQYFSQNPDVLRFHIVAEHLSKLPNPFCLSSSGGDILYGYYVSFSGASFCIRRITIVEMTKCPISVRHDSVEASRWTLIFRASSVSRVPGVKSRARFSPPLKFTTTYLRRLYGRISYFNFIEPLSACYAGTVDPNVVFGRISSSSLYNDVLAENGYYFGTIKSVEGTQMRKCDRGA